MTGVVGPSQVWSSWSLDPAALLLAVAALAVYVRGRARSPRPPSGRRLIAFASGVAAATLAVVGPLDPLAGSLVSAHMAQHLVLGVLAPLLIVAGRPIRVGTWAVAAPTRRELVRMTPRPLRRMTRRDGALVWVAAALQLAVWGLWHVPFLYDAALHHDVVHLVEHTSLLGAGLVLWWALSARTHPLRGAVASFGLGLGLTLLSALLVLAPVALYDTPAAGATVWETTPLDDQRLAGLLMWVPGGLLYLVVAVSRFAGWMSVGSARSAPRPRRQPLPAPRA